MQLPPPHAALRICEQRSTSREQTNDFNVHVVVKNSPFSLVLGLFDNNGSTIPYDLHNFYFEVSLLYNRPEEKEVDYINVKPIDFKKKFSERDALVTLECKIAVLTSQHEDTFFLIKVVASIKETQIQFETKSQPIKVVSKTNPVKKQTKQRVTSNTIMNKTQDIAKIQNQTKLIVQQILASQNTSESNASGPPSIVSQNQGLWSSRPTPPTSIHTSTLLHQNQTQLGAGSIFQPLSVISSTSDEDNFSTSFLRFMTCYKTLSRNEKLNYIERIISEYSNSDKQLLQEFLAQLQSYIGKHSCMCRPCPYENQFNQFDVEADLGLHFDLGDNFGSM